HRPDLLQGKTGEAEILQRIRRFRTDRGSDPSATLTQAKHANPRGFERLTAFVEWKLVEMPLPRLQFFGNADVRFIYQIGWDARVKRSGTLRDFDNRILFVDGASDNLVRLASLLRPLVQRQWAAMVARLNKLVDAQLEEFLFGISRTDLTPVRAPLRDLQHGRCFYCDAPLPSSACVDHFLPWARYPDDGIHNLVLADARCNGDKSAFLAAPGHLRRWAARSVDRAGTSRRSPRERSGTRIPGAP
ncbi:MAG TPA: HNH endonuclease domain-containing protein, partial [Polyangiaceae bacterium]